jgi:imidazolonepropionase-like amidohydrolase
VGQGQTTAVIAARLIDGTGKVIEEPVVLIKGETIQAVTDREHLPTDALIVDLGDYTLLPGLIDLHVHPNITRNDYQIEHLSRSSAEKALLSLRRVQDMLKAGWTTLRVAGDADIGYANLDVRDAINRGWFQGPTIYGAGHYISVTGGGGDINFLSYEQNITADGWIADGPDEIRKAIRKEIKYGSDWIKLLVTGAFMSANDNPKNVHFSTEELEAAVAEANRRNVPIMAHAHATEGIKMAVRAGVRTIEHGSFIDEEAMDLMIEKGTYLIPTFAVGLYAGYPLREKGALRRFMEDNKKSDLGVYDNMRLAIQKGVKFGLGTDDVGWPADFSAIELEAYVELGMTPMQAIECATRINAEILGKASEIGTVEAGKWADLIAVEGNPLEDITELRRVKFVMKKGAIIRQ